MLNKKPIPLLLYGCANCVATVNGISEETKEDNTNLNYTIHDYEICMGEIGTTKGKNIHHTTYRHYLELVMLVDYFVATLFRLVIN